MNEDIAKSKREALVRLLKDLDSLLVAFSGGVDSTFLLSLAHKTMGKKVVAVTSSSVIHSIREIDSAREFARKKGIRHIIVQPNELNLTDFTSNTSERCYHCKRNLFNLLFEISRDMGIKHVAHGANMDDLKDYRPGFRAAKEMGVIAPLVDVQLDKEEIRFLSQDMGLVTWDKPSMACLASRVPYGIPITEAKLKMIEDAETFLSDRGFSNVRVRHHGAVARIEMDREGHKKIIDKDITHAIVGEFRRIGFDHVALDLEGYTSGSLNRALGNMKKKRPDEWIAGSF
jgi:uncharacterized protein